MFTINYLNYKYNLSSYETMYIVLTILYKCCIY